MRLEAEIWRERERRASAFGERPGPSSAPARAPLRLSRKKSWEYRPYKDGYLQLELRRYVQRDGFACDRGPYWYF